VGDASFADAIWDRLAHHAQRLSHTGGSLRRLAQATTDAELADDSLTQQPPIS
jgi:hypothetical protein